MKRCLNFIKVCINLLLLLTTYTSSFAGGGGWEWQGYKFWSGLDITPYGLSHAYRHTIKGEGDAVRPTIIDEWANYFETSDHEHIKNIIFRSDLAELKDIQHRIHYMKSLPEKWENNSVAEFWLNNPEDESFQYIIYAKKCEPHATQVLDRWYQGETERDTSAMKQLIVEGLELHDKTESEHMRLRYAYQIVRLAHYLGMFRESIEYYEQLVETNSYNSIIRYYAKNQKAGAAVGIVRRDGEYSRAQIVLDFSSVFKNCGDCRMLTVYDLRFFNVEDFIDAAEMAETKQEEIGVWVLASIRALPIHIAIEKLMEIDPKARESEALLGRMIDNFQNQYSYSVRNEKQIENFRSSEEFRQSAATVYNASNHRLGNRPHIWSISAGMIHYMKGEYETARYLLNRGYEQSLAAHDRKAQKKATNMLTLVDFATLTPEQSENQQKIAQLIKEIKNIGNNSTAAYAVRNLYYFFDENELDVEAHITLAWLELELSEWLDISYRYYSSVSYTFFNYQSYFYCGVLQPHISDQSLEALIASYDSEDKSPIEEALWEDSYLNKTILMQFKAVRYFNNLNFKAAKEVLGQDPSYRNPGRFMFNDLKADPFHAPLRDCFSCSRENAREAGFSMTLYEFISKMVDLGKLHNNPESDSVALTEAHFKYATGLYNISQIGNVRYLQGDQIPYSRTNNLPEKHYLLAAEYSTDREFKARAIFLAAKSEQHAFYTKKSSYRNSRHNTPVNEVKNTHYRTNFQKLIDDYSDTRYFDKAKRECSYFSHFIQKQ